MIEKGDKHMKGDLFTKISLIIIVVLLALNIILPILSSPVPSYAAKNIQYKVITCEEPARKLARDLAMDGDSFEKLLNEYGKEGWELISAPCLSGGVGIIIFKR